MKHEQIILVQFDMIELLSKMVKCTNPLLMISYSAQLMALKAQLLKISSQPNK